MKTWIDRGNTNNIRNFERMTAELTPYMTELEIDQVVSFMDTLSRSQYDINPSVDDSAGQLRIMLGAERYEQIKAQWAARNQHLIRDGRTKWVRISDGSVWDGLDPEDHPGDYRRITM